MAKTTETVQAVWLQGLLSAGWNPGHILRRPKLEPSEEREGISFARGSDDPSLFRAVALSRTHRFVMRRDGASALDYGDGRGYLPMRVAGRSRGGRAARSGKDREPSYVKAVVLDWGDTVMRVFPECRGPMTEWPVVETIAGIEEALSRLAMRWTLGLVSNAGESDSRQVRRALARVGLEDSFDLILTAKDVGVSKSDPRFYQRLLAILGRPPGEVVVVGDDYQADVRVPTGLGMRAVWFNPGGRQPPGRACHAAEVARMPDLVDTITTLEAGPNG